MDIEVVVVVVVVVVVSLYGTHHIPSPHPVLQFKLSVSYKPCGLGKTIF